jgi:hypothetical protein
LQGVRGAVALAKLPERERQQWEKFWQDVKHVERRAAEPEKYRDSR